MPFVNVKDVSKTFQTREGLLHALDSVSFDVAENEFISILGPSGCGKSTLLSLIAGLLSPSSGEVRILGKAIKSPYTDLGIVFQRDVLLDWRTVLGNVMIQQEIRRQDHGASLSRARELLSEVGLSDFERAYPFELSGGMRQRVAICRALVHDPSLIIMDEPFAALDALTRDQMNLDLLALWETRRKTVIFVTHSVSEAVFLSDKVLVMTSRPGKLLKTLAIDLSRPRTFSQRDGSQFHAYNSEIMALLKDAGILLERRR